MLDDEYLENLLAMSLHLGPQGLESYIVVFENDFEAGQIRMQFWAESAEHAYWQGQNAEPRLNIIEVFPEFKVIYPRNSPNASWNLPK